MNKLKFSLILCTIGRVETLRIFLNSLLIQTYMNFELIIVDQNIDNRVDKLIDEYKSKLKIKHIKSNPGLSKARNEGLKYCLGDIIAFPDDDCEYTPDMLNKINKFFCGNNNYDFLTIKMTNSFKDGRKIQSGIMSQEITKNNCLKLSASISMFFKKNVVDNLDGFDENLGLGTKTVFKGSEDYDYPLQAISKGFKGFFCNEIEILHPWDNEELDRSKNLHKRGFYGGASEMYVLNKHYFSFSYKLIRILRRLLIVLYYFVKLDFYKMKQSIFILKGMIKFFNRKAIQNGYIEDF